ncbi:hypothetical protein BZL30_4562 [Mycobacterium kansasii]|uniref:Uncharacterized protein n=1 Tax=Mycobacterium kansasii TaxID=1768 RepID=A0A1V3X5V1_MYCKA|nr:hypothetical protein BZL30_4562 [Mycobacterium kansasii]
MPALLKPSRHGRRPAAPGCRPRPGWRAPAGISLPVAQQHLRFTDGHCRRCRRIIQRHIGIHQDQPAGVFGLG